MKYRSSIKSPKHFYFLRICLTERNTYGSIVTHSHIQNTVYSFFCCCFFNIKNVLWNEVYSKLKSEKFKTKSLLYPYIRFSLKAFTIQCRRQPRSVHVTMYTNDSLSLVRFAVWSLQYIDMPQTWGNLAIHPTVNTVITYPSFCSQIHQMIGDFYFYFDQ